MKEIKIPFLDVTVDFDYPTPGVKSILSVVRPDWASDKIQIQPFKGGLLNLTLCCCPESDIACQHALVIRVTTDTYNVFINRPGEVPGLVLGHESGCNSPILALFHNGFVMGYAIGHCMTYRDIWNPKIARAVCHVLAKLHSTDVSAFSVSDDQGRIYSIEKRCLLFEKLQATLHCIPDHVFQKLTDVPSRSVLTEEVTKVDLYLRSLGLPLVLCHNDIRPHNMIVDEQTGTVKLIDFEMTFYNYAAYDLAVLFFDKGVLEICGLYEEDDPTPDKDIHLMWIRHYLEAEREIQGDKTDIVITNEYIENYYDIFRKFLALWHLRSVVLCILAKDTPKSSVDFDRCATLCWKAYQREREGCFPW